MALFTKTVMSISAMTLFSLPVIAQDHGEAVPAPSPGLFGGNFMFIMIAMFVIIYFLMIRPEQKKQKERQKMLSALKKGDKILTIGGIVALITNVKDTTYIVKTGEGSVLEITKSAVSSVLNNDTSAQDDKK
ncbi:MAG: preprotein translocase subunit YajC [Chitinispirillales bacterium]|nr:preprotein translocase subunit YajC [Chitinispirillales bacterium]